MPSLAELQVPPPSGGQDDELDKVRALVAKRTTDDVERILWWNVGGPAYRWNQIAVDEMLDGFVTTLPATRNLALLHAAIDDAVAAAWAAKREIKRPRPAQADPSLAAAMPLPEGSAYPSDHAAAAAAAAGCWPISSPPARTPLAEWPTRRRQAVSSRAWSIRATSPLAGRSARRPPRWRSRAARADGTRSQMDRKRPAGTRKVARRQPHRPPCRDVDAVGPLARRRVPARRATGLQFQHGEGGPGRAQGLQAHAREQSSRRVLGSVRWGAGLRPVE